MNVKPISIVTGRLIATGKTQVTERYSKEVAREIAKFKADIQEIKAAKCTEEAKSCVLDYLNSHLSQLQESANKIRTFVTEFVDSKGARYVETIEKDNSNFGTGTPVRKLVKKEEEFMKDGKKIVTTTTHDKSDHLLMGEGHQDGLIKKVENFYTKDGVKIGRRTTTQQASGYGGKTVEKELSKDGQELGEHNTARTITRFTEGGKRDSRTSYEPYDVSGFEVPCNEKGLPQVESSNIKYGW